MRRAWFLYGVLVAAALVALGALVLYPRIEGTLDGDLQVSVSILPQQYFVDRIGGDRVQAEVIVVPGASPHTYEPKPEQLRAVSASAAYFTIGVDFERAWLERIRSANPNMKLVDTAAGIQRLALADHHHDDEDDDHDADDDDDDEDNPDPHIWLSPQLVRRQAGIIYEALAEIDPEHQAEYAANLNAFLADIDALEAEIEQALAGVTHRAFMVFHPSWGYFAHDFGLEQIPIEVGGQEPSAQDLARIITEAREKDIKVIFAQPEFSTRAAETIARELGGEVLLISPLEYDWLANMRQVAQAFAQVLQ